MIDFLYTDSSDLSHLDSSVRFLTLEKIVGDFMYNCGQEETVDLPFNDHQASMEKNTEEYR